MIRRLIANLQAFEPEIDGEQIADLLWLAQYVAIAAPSKPEPTSDPANPAIRTERVEGEPATREGEDPSLPVSAASTTAPVYTSESVEAVESAETAPRLAFRAAAPRALRKPIELERALRSLMGKVPSRSRYQLDEVATAERIAETRMPTPVKIATRERWLDVALVVEETSLTEIWRKSIDEFQRLLEHLGAFRDVRVWTMRRRLNEPEAPQPPILGEHDPVSPRIGGLGGRSSNPTAPPPEALEIFPRHRRRGSQRRVHSHQELRDPSRRRLILVLSDCTSESWWEGKIHPWLKDWAAVNMVSVIHLLPQRMWERGILGEGLPVRLRSRTPGTLNHQWHLEGLPVWRSEAPQSELTLPVVTLEPEALAQWARAIAGLSEFPTAGVVFEAGWQQAIALPVLSPEQPTGSLSQEAITQQAQQSVAQFRKDASPMARRLAVLMAAAPVDLAVVGLIQETVLKQEAKQVHVAEVYLGGLMQRVGEPGAARFEFKPGVRAELRKSLPRSEARQVLEAVSEYIADRLKSPLPMRSLEAVLMAELPQDDAAEVLPFAEIAIETLRQMGGNYATFAGQIVQRRSAGSPELEPTRQEESSETVVSSPSLQTFEFDVANIAFDDDSSTSESGEVHAAAIAWLRNHQIEVLRSQPNQPIDEDYAQLATDLGESYPILKDLLNRMRRSLHNADERKRNSFQFTASSETDFRICHAFCKRLRDSSLLETYTSSSRGKFLRGQFKSEARDVMAFLDGRWFEQYVRQKILRLLQERGLSYSYLVNSVVGSPNGDRIELDLFFLVEGKPLLIECRSIATVDPEGIRRVSQYGNSLAIPPSQVFLVALALSPEELELYNQRFRNLVVVSRENFLAAIQAVLEDSPARDPVLPLETVEFEVVSISVTRPSELEWGEAFGIVDQAMRVQTGKSLTALQQEIVEATWQGRSYDEVAEAEGCSTSQVSTVAAQLFRHLSQQLGIPISKKTLRQAVIQFAGASDQPELTLLRQHRQARQFIETLDNDIELAMVAIPEGEFLMGSPEDEEGRSNSETPQHPVSIRPFFMGKYPITQAQWKAVAALPQVKRSLRPLPSRFKGDLRPVERISWFEAVEFCARLSAHTNREYRLPSEAEWEYACRAGTTTTFHFGETLTPDLANYNGNYTYRDGPKGQYRQQTTPVGRFEAANAFGLCDMHGNVYEWCQDHWHSNYEGAPTDGSVWLSENEGSRRILRGGSWVDSPRNCRSAFRFDHYPVNVYDFIGFRVVCVVPRSPWLPAGWTL